MRAKRNTPDYRTRDSTSRCSADKVERNSAFWGSEAARATSDLVQFVTRRTPWTPNFCYLQFLLPKEPV